MRAFKSNTKTNTKTNTNTNICWNDVSLDNTNNAICDIKHFKYIDIHCDNLDSDTHSEYSDCTDCTDCTDFTDCTDCTDCSDYVDMHCECFANPEKMLSNQSVQSVQSVQFNKHELIDPIDPIDPIDSDSFYFEHTSFYKDFYELFSNNLNQNEIVELKKKAKHIAWEKFKNDMENKLYK